MPTHTPSPHRFLAPRSTSSKSKTQSSLRNALAATTEKANDSTRQQIELKFKKPTSSKRFIVDPTWPKEQNTRALTDHELRDFGGDIVKTQLTPRPKPKRSLKRIESIDETSQSSPAATQDEGEHNRIEFSIDHESTLGKEERDQDEDGQQEMLFASVERAKRRRISPPTSPSNSCQQTPVQTHNLTSHRFKTPVQRATAPFANLYASGSFAQGPFVNTAATLGPSTTPAPQRPHFLLPALPTSPPRPLPEIFSPSRKSAKHLPSGLASTVTGWIIEAANTGFAVQTGRFGSRQAEESVKLRIRVKCVSKGSHTAASGEEDVDCFTGGVAFVTGTTEPGLYNASRSSDNVENNDEIRILLAGQGGAKASRGVKIRVGSMVEIKQPMWHVEICDERWTVGVDWAVL